MTRRTRSGDVFETLPDGTYRHESPLVRAMREGCEYGQTDEQRARNGACGGRVKRRIGYLEGTRVLCDRHDERLMATRSRLPVQVGSSPALGRGYRP